MRRKDGLPPRERGSGSYTQRVEGGPVEYRRDGLSATGKGKREALARWKIKDALRQAERARLTDATTGAYLLRWLDARAQEVAYNTHRRYTSTITHHLIPALGDVPLDQLTPRDVQEKIVKMRATLSANSVEKVRSVLSIALTHAVDEGLLRENVVKRTRPPRLTPREGEPLTLDQTRHFLAAARHDPLYPLYVVTLALGLRQGEALGLRWQDVDGQTAWIRTNLIDRKGGFALGGLKGKRSRVVNLPRVAIVAFDQQRCKNLPSNEWGLIFVTRRGTPLRGAWVRKKFKQALVDAGLPPRRFHDLRHSAASLLAHEGLSLKETQILLGHANIGITGNIYVHAFAEGRQRAADLMDGLLSVP